MQKFNGSLVRQFPSLVTGNAGAGVSVTVYAGDTGSTLATLFSGDGTGSLSNPLTTDSAGYYAFYAADGVYRLNFGLPNIPDQLIQLVDVAEIRADFDAIESSNAAFLVEQQANYDAFVLSQGWDQVGTFSAGFTFESPNQVGQDADGNWWRWNGAFPKVVTAGTLPSSDPDYKLVGDGVLRSDLATTDSSVLVGAVKAGILSLAEKLAVQPGQFFGNIQAAIDYAYTNNRGFVFVPSGEYTITEPLIVPPGLTVFGERNKTTITKISATTHTGAAGIAVNSIFHLDNPEGGFNFYSKISGFNLIGSNVVDGVYIGNSAHLILENINMNNVNNGLSSALCFMVTLDHIRVGSGNVGFNFSSNDDKTSLTFKNCYAEACGSAYVGRAIKYSTMFSCGADYINSGGLPGNPYGAAARGNYLAQGFVFDFAACDITINGSGSERCNATYLRAESCNLVFNSCTVFNCENFYAPTSTNTAAVWLAGTARCTVEFNACAFDPFINSSGLTSNLVKGAYVETPSAQKLIYTNPLLFTGYAPNYSYEGGEGMFLFGDTNVINTKDLRSNQPATSLPFDLYNAGVYSDAELAYVIDANTKRKSILFSGLGSGVALGTTIDHRWRLLFDAAEIAGRAISVRLAGSYSTGGFGNPSIDIVNAPTFASAGTVLYTSPVSGGVVNTTISLKIAEGSTGLIAVQVIIPYNGVTVTISDLDIRLI